VLVRLLLKFDVVENGQPDVEEPIIKMGLTLTHRDGVLVRLYSST
jgi:hypothetical protein